VIPAELTKALGGIGSAIGDIPVDGGGSKVRVDLDEPVAEDVAPDESTTHAVEEALEAAKEAAEPGMSGNGGTSSGTGSASGAQDQPEAQSEVSGSDESGSDKAGLDESGSDEATKCRYVLELVRSVYDGASQRLKCQVESDNGRRYRGVHAQRRFADGVHNEEIAVHLIAGRRSRAHVVQTAAVVAHMECPVG